MHGRTYLVFEASPRVGGYAPGDTHVSFGIEQQAGGHVFQLNFSNGIGHDPGPGRARRQSDDWYLGFNISRKFF